MTTTSMSLRAAPRQWHRPLMLLAGAMSALTVVALVGLVVDDRQVLGAPIWLKPFKFGVSMAVYAVTLAWMTSLLVRGRRTAWWAGAVVAVTGAAEVGLIAMQAARGRQSHFNNSTALDAAIFQAMGMTIAVLYAATLVIALLLMIQRVGTPDVTWTLRLGLVIALVGMGLGFLMVLPTPEQQAADIDAIVGAHSVGVPDGGAGMPVTGWSTTGGDLRIPHFVGMHALQALPLLAIALGLFARRFPRLRDGGVRLRLILVAAAAYAGLVALVTWQALRGQPLTAPDGATLAAAGLLAAAVLGGAMLVLRRRTPAPSPGRQPMEVYG